MVIRNISTELAEIAKKTINENPSRIQADIEAVKIWLMKQPHLQARMDDQWILSFLRWSKFSIERTKEKLDTYYTYKTILVEFFGDRDPLRPEIQAVLKLGTTAYLPKPDKLGRQICLTRCTLSDPKKIKSADIMRVNFMNMDVAILDGDRSVIAGDVIILDFKGATFEQMTSMTPTMIKKAMAVYQDAYPIRPQAVHYINTNSFFEATFNIFKSFMKKKLQDRLFVYGSDYSKLYEHVPRDILPEEYGGHLPSIEVFSAEWKNKVESYRDWFVEDSKFKCDETKRPVKAKTSSELFGVEGSFRALSLD